LQVVAHVARAGSYLATVTVATRAPASNVVHLVINKVELTAATTPTMPRATVSAQVAVPAHQLTIRASASQRATLSVSWRRLGSTGKPPGSTGVAVTQAPTAPAPTPSGAPAGPWHAIFDDEFNGDALDGSHWTSGWYASPLSGPIDPSDEQECYARSHIVEGSGELDLNLTASPARCPSGNGPLAEPFTSAMVTTTNKFSFTYGFVEARVWLPGSPAVTDWPAVWAVGQNVPWPQGGEIDLVEGLRGSPCWHFHEPLGAPGGCPAGAFTAGWHTFAADWEPGSVTWYYDGTDVGTVTSGVTATPMFLLMNLAVDQTFGGAIQAPATLRIDYMRVWQH
jgi:beta-glucanase (GH16 family)